MPKRVVVLLALLLVAWSLPAQADPPETAAKAKKPRADLVAKAVSATYVDGVVTVRFTVKNKGRKKAPPTQSLIKVFVSPTKIGPQDVGTVSTPALRPGRSVTLTATYLDDVLPSGDASFLACAGYQGVKQRNLSNDCRYSESFELPPRSYLSWTVRPVGAGTVAGTSTSEPCQPAVANPTGTCSARAGGSMTLTAAAATGFLFDHWEAAAGKACSGTPSGDRITVAAPTPVQDCVAVFATSF